MESFLFLAGPRLALGFFADQNIIGTALEQLGDKDS